MVFLRKSISSARLGSSTSMYYDLFVATEQTQPHFRKERSKQTHRGTCSGHRDGAGPGDLAGTTILFGTPIGADHRDDRGSETESQRQEDVFEASAHRVADGGLFPEAAGNTRQQHHGHVRYDHIDQSRRAYLEDFGE